MLRTTSTLHEPFALLALSSDILLMVQKYGGGIDCPYRIYTSQMRHGLKCLRACVGCGIGLLLQSLVNPLGRQGGKNDHFPVYWYYHTMLLRKGMTLVTSKGYSPIVIKFIYYNTIDASLPCSFEYICI